MHRDGRLRDFHVGTLVVVDGLQGGRIPVWMLTDLDLVVKVIAERPLEAAVLRPTEAVPEKRHGFPAAAADSRNAGGCGRPETGRRRIVLVPSTDSMFTATSIPSSVCST